MKNQGNYKKNNKNFSHFNWHSVIKGLIYKEKIIQNILAQ